LTGRSGIGKTTVLRAAAHQLAPFHPAGFYTEEIRADRERLGFGLVTFAGEESIITRIPLPRRASVGMGVEIDDRSIRRRASEWLSSETL
jgi:nucleoside-triphosphatase